MQIAYASGISRSRELEDDFARARGGRVRCDEGAVWVDLFLSGSAAVNLDQAGDDLGYVFLALATIPR